LTPHNYEVISYENSAPGGGHPEYARVQAGENGVFFNGTLSVRMRFGMRLGKDCLLIVCVVLASATAMWAAPTTPGGGRSFLDDLATACAGSVDPTVCVCEIISVLCPETVSSLGAIPGSPAVGARADAGTCRLLGLPVENLVAFRRVPTLAAMGAVAWLCFSLDIQSAPYVGRGTWLTRLPVLAVEPRAPPH